MITLGGSFTMLLTSFIESVSGIVGRFLSSWIYIYNEILTLISNISSATVEGLSMRPVLVVLLLVIILLLTFFIDTKNLLVFRLFTICFVMTMLVAAYHEFAVKRNMELVLYEINHKSRFDFFIGQKCYSNAIVPDQDIVFNVEPNRLFHKTKDIYDINSFENARMIGENILIHIDGFSVLFINECFL